MRKIMASAALAVAMGYGLGCPTEASASATYNIKVHSSGYFFTDPCCGPLGIEGSYEFDSFLTTDSDNPFDFSASSADGYLKRYGNGVSYGLGGYDHVLHSDVSIDGSSFLQISNGIGVSFGYTDPYEVFISSYGPDHESIDGFGDYGSTIQFTISQAPLPSSAPLFGAAIIALGGVGYMRGRRARKAG